jgi:hypothetical protein
VAGASSDHSATATLWLSGRCSGRLVMQLRQTSATARGRSGTSRTGVGAMCRSRAAATSASGPPGYGDRPVSIW